MSVAIDPTTDRQALRIARKTGLTSREARTLAALMHAGPNVIVSLDAIFAAMQSTSNDPQKSVQSEIHRMRQKLRTVAAIECVRSRGYSIARTHHAALVDFAGPDEPEVQGEPLAQWKLTPQQTQLVRLLITRARVTLVDFNAALMADGDKAIRPKHFDVLLHYTRRKLEPFGLEIETLRQRGASFSPTSRLKLAQIFPEAPFHGPGL